MDYREYKKSRDLAWEILLREGVRELPVPVGKLCRGMGIRVGYFDPEPGGSDGFSLMIGERAGIAVSRRCSVERQRFTCAHELGHILLGHVGTAGLVNREPDPGDNPIERAANVFASRLLAPACVLWALDARTPEQIAELCRISLQAATFRAQRMELLWKRDRFLTSPLERQVYEQFRDFIQAHRSSDASGI